MWAPALGRSARVAGTCLSLFSLLIRLVLALLCELASLSQTVPLLTYLLPCDLRKLPQMTASAFHFCPVCWQSQVCTWLVSRSTRSCHQSAVHLSTYRCPNSYTQPVSCKLNYKCFYICFKCAFGWGWGGMCHSTSIEVREQLVNARVNSSMTWVPGVKFSSLGLERLLGLQMKKLQHSGSQPVGFKSSRGWWPSHREVAWQIFCMSDISVMIHNTIEIITIE